MFISALLNFRRILKRWFGQNSPSSLSDHSRYLSRSLIFHHHPPSTPQVTSDHPGLSTAGITNHGRSRPPLLAPVLPLSTFHPLTPAFSLTINSSFSLSYLELSPVFLSVLQNPIAVVPVPITMVPSVMSASPCFKTCP